MDGIGGGGLTTTTTAISSMSANNNNFDIDFMEQLLDVGGWWSSQSSFSHGSRFIHPVINSPTSNSVITSTTTSPPISPNFPFDQANFFINPFSQHQTNYSVGNKLIQNQIWSVLSSNNNPTTPTSTTSPHKTGEENPGRRHGRSSTVFEDQNPTTIHPVVESNTIWIPPTVSVSTHSGPLLLTTVEERLTRAIWHFQALMISQENKFNKEVLVQIWVPIRKGAKTLLTTAEQPHFYHPPCKPLLSYRTVSEKYEFSANVDDDKDDVDVVRGRRYSLGLPGRVFLGKAPEWTPDVRFFKQEEYPRVTYAQLCDVRGSIALPVFERGGNEKRPCLGVIEIVSTAQKIHYRSEVETVCRALEAVDLQSSDILFPSKKKDGTQEPCTQELFELFGIIRTVCDKHGLPLGQTWSPCSTQQLTKSTTTTTTTSSSGCWRSNSGSKPHHCLSTITSACYVRDQQVLGFHQACTEHHLYKGQGLVGNAIMTNQPCFATDLTAYSNVDYPLSHHAKIFGVHGSVALHIQRKNSNNGLLVSSACDDYVLELLLPLNIQDSGLTFHMKVLESLSMAVQGSHSFRLVQAAGEPAKEIAFFPSNNETLLSLSNGRDNYGGDEHNARGLQLQSGGAGGFSKSTCHEERSWISELIESQKKGKEVAISLGYNEEEPKEEFKLTWSDDNDMDSLRGGILADHSGFGSSSSKELQSTEGGDDGSNSYGGGNKRSGVKRKTKTPKTISLDVLKQYFAGSLKDAARSIGVCPTTLKRICRQHGINRWPSRKIKKVGHSLKKLQLVMDSVQGAQGSIQLSSFYSNFPDLSGPNAENAANDATNNQIIGGDSAQDFSSGGNTTTSPCSSSGKTSASSHSFSTGTRASPVPSTTANAATTNNSGGDTSATTANGQDLTAAAFLKRARSEAELLVVATHHDQRSSALLDRSRSDKSLMVEPTKWANTYHRLDPIPRTSTQKAAAEAAAYPAERLSYKVKATFGEENIRLTLTPNMGFLSLQQEIARRFRITDLNKIYIKYLDDDSEWVLMTCDDDLHECIDVNRSSGSHTVKLSVHQATVSLENNMAGFTGTKSG